MAINTINLPQPSADAVVSQELPEDASAVLNFSSSDIKGLSLGDAGELIIEFTDGGKIAITNFESFSSQGNTIQFNDGIEIDPNNVALTSSSEMIAQPAADEVNEVSLVPGQKYACAFDPANAAKVEIVDGQMILTFADGSQVVINNYSEVMAGELPAELTLADGTVVSEEELLTQVTEVAASVEEILEEVAEEAVEPDVAEQVAQVEPAAGDEANIAQQLAQIEPAAGEQAGSTSNTGFGFGSTPGDGNFDAAQAIGPLGPTALNYGIPAFDEENLQGDLSPVDDRPIIQTSSSAVDDTDLGSGPLSTSGSVSVNYGNDGPGQILPNGTVTITCNSAAGGALRTGGQDVTITQTADGYVGTITGSSPVVTVFEFTIDPTTGDYTYTQYLPLDHSDTTDDNEDICIDFGFTAIDSDGDRTSSSVRISVFDDGPTVFSQIERTVDETDMVGGKVTTTGQFVADAGQDGFDSYSLADPSTFSAGGSLAGGALTSDGNPVTVTLSGNTYTGTANGVTIFTLELNTTTGEYEFTLCGPLDHADGTDPNDSIQLNFDIQITDGDGDTASGTVTINVLDDAPEVDPVVSTVDETDLSSGTVTVTGNVDVDFGADDDGTVAGNDSFASSGSQMGGALTSNGNPVTVTFDSNTGVYTGTANGATVFTMTINADGSYSFELLGNLDHADPNDPNDIINLDFGVTVTDGEGDTATSIVRVQVKDDVPVIGDSQGDVDETNLDGGPLSYSDTIDHNFGLDLGSISLNGTGPTGVTTNGVPVVVTASGNTYTGVANGVTIFTLTVDPTTGQYTYTQFEEIDHADPNDPNDVVSLDFGVTITSGDGTTDTGTITINVADDAPIAVDDINGAEEGQLITGNVVANDDLSEDNPNTVTNVRFGGTDYPIPAGGSATITTTLGTLTMNSDGTYTYVSHNNDPDGIDQFTYTFVDNDGDSDTANLSITVTPDGQPVAVDETLAVDETNLTPGPMIFNGDVNVDFGVDNNGGTVTAIDPSLPGGFEARGSLMGGTFTSDGNPVTVTLSGNTYTGTANGVTIFTLQVNADGSYVFELLEHIDHADSTDPNDIITLDFGVTATDGDGDSADGTITIHIHDDAPVAYDDATVAVMESEVVTGNVTSNDEFGEDDPNHVVQVTFNGTDYAVPATGVISITGNYGTLVIASDGSYTYTGGSDNPDGVDTFTYVLEDFDGDQDTAEFSFTVSPDDDTPIIVTPPRKEVDETDLDGGPLTESGTISVDYGSDAPGEVNPNGDFSAAGNTGGNLTSCGHPVTVTVVGNTYTGTANGQTIFTMTINENGDYTFTQFHAIDHSNTNNANEHIDLHFGATATDSDGDTASTTATVRVRDDAPEISNKFQVVDE
ncbi:MAG: hypothetical protein HRT94_08740, partial [Alphaproteobacteria bacterium]|nr:hypothetical protein [Alphaproteobacteria bacterium]